MRASLHQLHLQVHLQHYRSHQSLRRSRRIVQLPRLRDVLENYLATGRSVASKTLVAITAANKIQFPHLIIPINSANANEAYHTSYNGTASGSTSSIFNFDIPQSYAGKTCSLQFLFPMLNQLETSAYEFSGAGQFEFAILEGAANQETTYATAPSVAYSFGTFDVMPGTAVDLGSCPEGCPAGKVVSFWMNAVGDSSLNYFQDSNPCRKSISYLYCRSILTAVYSDRPLCHCFLSGHWVPWSGGRAVFLECVFMKAM